MANGKTVKDFSKAYVESGRSYTAYGIPNRSLIAIGRYAKNISGLCFVDGDGDVANIVVPTTGITVTYNRENESLTISNNSGLGAIYFLIICGGGIRHFKALYLNALRHLKGGAWHDWKCKTDNGLCGQTDKYKQFDMESVTRIIQDKYKRARYFRKNKPKVCNNCWLCRKASILIDRWNKYNVSVCTRSPNKCGEYGNSCVFLTGKAVYAA